MLPKLVERAGTTEHRGSITGIYTVLVESDDLNDPVADAVRSLLDGHIVLTRELTMQNHYPAIDVLKSISRVMDDVVNRHQRELAGRFKEILATYRKAEDLINIGAYVQGSNPKIDEAIDKIDRITRFLKQDIQQRESLGHSVKDLEAVLAD